MSVQGTQSTHSHTQCKVQFLRPLLQRETWGFFIDPELKFRKQASSAVSKAAQILSLVRRAFANIDEHTMPLLFKTLVRPHLEYGNLIWGPFNRADEKLVERVQRRATKMVESIRSKPYQAWSEKSTFLGAKWHQEILFSEIVTGQILLLFFSPYMMFFSVNDDIPTVAIYGCVNVMYSPQQLLPSTCGRPVWGT